MSTATQPTPDRRAPDRRAPRRSGAFYGLVGALGGALIGGAVSLASTYMDSSRESAREALETRREAYASFVGGYEAYYQQLQQLGEAAIAGSQTAY